jgi:hypothetical protein
MEVSGQLCAQHTLPSGGKISGPCWIKGTGAGMDAVERRKNNTPTGTEP